MQSTLIAFLATNNLAKEPQEFLRYIEATLLKLLEHKSANTNLIGDHHIESVYSALLGLSSTSLEALDLFIQLGCHQLVDRPTRQFNLSCSLQEWSQGHPRVVQECSQSDPRVILE